ncbi:glycosyltransferase [Acinetobacter sp. VNK23]|uniref:glycosyltransferase family 4 protein n=1 Tax=Acinetobacter thutiue TaxID=2998078 RepID=UPI002577B8C7|nr:glycosyltransferase [Acinetobacter thutiue]MDM1021732.1 glycosyltransferase [Acinetobacter thutiue]
MKKYTFKSQYIYIDPFNSSNSGVTNYIKASKKILEENLIIKVDIIQIKDTESIYEFSLRVTSLLKKMDYFCVEFPESMATSRFLEDYTKVHIRIHCGKTLGKFIQNQYYKKEEYFAEKEAITKAKWVSSPSYLGWEFTSDFYKVKRSILIYPNPLDLSFIPEYSFDNKNIPVLFLGRFQNLKGINFLKKIQKKLPFKITILTNDKSYKSSIFRVEYHTTIEEKFQVLTKTKILIVPSIFDIYSMVSLEAIACQAKVITWSHIGITEYFDNDKIIVIKPWNIELFSEMILNTLKNKEYFEKEEVKKINILFINFFHDFLNLRTTALPPHDLAVKQLKLNDLKIKIENLSIFNRRNRFYRKIKKLITNPINFFIDFIIKIRNNFLI